MINVDRNKKLSEATLGDLIEILEKVIVCTQDRETSLLTYEQAGHYIGAYRQKIYELIKGKILHPYRIKGSRQNFIKKTELDQYLNCVNKHTTT